MDKETILKTACELFLREGMQDMRMRTVAEKIGIPKHELCSLFPAKWELVAASVANRLQRLDESLNALHAAAGTPVEALLRISVVLYDAFGEVGWQFAEDVAYFPSAIDALHGARRAFRKRQQTVFMQGVDEGYLLGEAYYGLLEKLFWQNFTIGERDRDAVLRMLFTVVRGSATEKGWREAERVRREMALAC